MLPLNGMNKAVLKPLIVIVSFYDLYTSLDKNHVY